MVVAEIQAMSLNLPGKRKTREVARQDERFVVCDLKTSISQTGWKKANQWAEDFSALESAFFCTVALRCLFSLFSVPCA